MLEKLRCGIIGCGAIAPTHAECFAAQEGVELAWACDLVEAKARRLAEKYGIANVTTDYRNALADETLDIVTVCTDHASHSPISVAALCSGKHVLCEKALAASRNGLDDMLAAGQRNPQLIFGGVFQHRFDAANRYFKQLVDDGALGTLLTGAVHVRCRRTKEYYRADQWRGTWAEEGGAALINQAIHYIDLLAWVMGGVESLCGTHGNLTHGDVLEAEDTAVAALRFGCGALGSLEVTSSSHLQWENTISVHGTVGSVELRNGGAIKVLFEDESLQAEVIEKFRRAGDLPGVDIGKSHYGTGHLAQITDFVDAVRNASQPFVSAAAASHAVDLVLGIYRSAHDGGWVKVPPLQ
jgi:predicted dehydrogenase